MHQDQGGVCRKNRKVVEQRQLHCRSGEPFNSMNAADMNQSSRRPLIAEPGDIDPQTLAPLI